ncbi:MAG: hypothetical protein JW395_1750 [Nitrospira sp.]|nr:hypothetical protein [Nitrospira sp.]
MAMRGVVDEGSTFEAPVGDEQRAGTKLWRKPRSPFEFFMEEEGIPVWRGLGMRDVRELPRTDWKRLGGKGSYIQFDGADGIHSMYVLEIPGGAALNDERHNYDANFYVVEGRGTTEVWYDGTKKHTFEWAAGTLFTIPTNSWHRLVNAGSAPCIIIAGTTAPTPMNEFPDADFIFDNPYQFVPNFGTMDDYYKPRDELEITSYSGRAARRSNILPDLINCELPLDNQRLPGFRRIEPYLGSGLISHIVWGYPSGRYSRAHGHSSGAIIICLRGRAYTMNWPLNAGITPFEDGKGDVVNRIDYVAGGMVTAAPGGGAWFHQHFACSKEEPRFLVFSGSRWHGGGTRANEQNYTRPGESFVAGNWDLEEGGGSIGYYQEDPEIRKIYEAELAREGAPFTMPENVYTRPKR